MISERYIAEKFSVVWKQSFPLLTPSFMKAFNETRIQTANIYPVLVKEDVRFDLVSEAAFNLSQMVIENGVDAEDYLFSYSDSKDLVEKTGRSIWPPDWQYIEQDELTRFEKDDILHLCKNTVEFITSLKKEYVKFRPGLKGYGIIPYVEADLEIDDALFEIKTVTRNFKSTDLKQLLMYLALKQASDGQNWKTAGLYNPRKGTFCKFNINQLVNSITGGISPIEAFETMLNNLTRDIEVDALF